MRRLPIFVTIAAAAFTAACSDKSVSPSSPLRPSVASLDVGTPPPPPIAGEGFLELDIFSGDDSSPASLSCSATETTDFAYEYFVNKPGNNAFLHVHTAGNGLDFSIHQTNKKVDASGSVSGPGFSFAIDNALGGTIIDPHGHVPGSVTVQLEGTLTTVHGTCSANATLTASLTNS